MFLSIGLVAGLSVWAEGLESLLRAALPWWGRVPLPGLMAGQARRADQEFRAGLVLERLPCRGSCRILGDVRAAAGAYRIR
jgi:hypothetical protein